MDHPFYKQQAHEYYLKCHNLFEKELAASLPTPYPSVFSETSRKDYVYFEPLHIDQKKLTGPDLESLLNVSFESPSLFPDKNTYYIYDMSQLKETPYNTLMFQLNEAPKKSMETTTIIMNRYFESRRVPYTLMNLMGEPLGYKQMLPYVFGDTCFVPESGATKKPASWYALHSVSEYVCHAKEKEVSLYSGHYPLLTLKTDKSSFEEQLNRSAHLYYIQSRLRIEYLQQHGSIKMEPKAENLLDRFINTRSYHMPNYTAFDLIFYFIVYFTHKNLTLILGPDNPYLDEVKERFKFPPFPLN